MFTCKQRIGGNIESGWMPMFKPLMKMEILNLRFLEIMAIFVKHSQSDQRVRNWED